MDIAPGCRDGHHPLAPIGNVEELPFSGHWGRARRRPGAHPAAQLRITRISASSLPCGFPHQDKNGLLTGHPASGWRSAVIDRLPVTARRAGLDPAKWLEDVLRRIPTATTAALHELLPCTWKPATA